MRLPWLQRVTGNQGSIPEREPEKRLPHPRKAAGTQITHSRHGEVVTKNNEAVLYEARHRNGYNLNPLTRIYWRASLVPAAAVIPAPIAYIKVVAVKKLVVGSAAFGYWSSKSSVLVVRAYLAGIPFGVLQRMSIGTSTFT